MSKKTKKPLEESDIQKGDFMRLKATGHPRNPQNKNLHLIKKAHRTTFIDLIKSILSNRLGNIAAMLQCSGTYVDCIPIFNKTETLCLSLNATRDTRGKKS